MSRITNSMLTSNYLSDLQVNLRNMSTLQSQMSSGQKIQRASDNPTIATKTLTLNNELAANEQYSKNIKDATNWLDTTDASLSEASNVLSRIRELMVKAGNGTYSDTEISTIKDEVVSATKELGQVLNTSYDGSYIFGGTKSTSKPVTVDADGNMSYLDKDGNSVSETTVASLTTTTVTLSEDNQFSNSSKTVKSISKDSGGNFTLTYTDGSTGSGTSLTTAGVDSANQTKVTALLDQADATIDQISSDLTTEISEGVNVGYNETASSLMKFDNNGTSVNGMEVLSRIIKNLGLAANENSSPTSADATSDITDTSDTTTYDTQAKSALSGTNLKELDSIINNFSQARTSVGTNENRMESAATTNEDENYNMTNVLSSVADVDYAEASVNYSSAQQIYTASLQVSSKVISNTLLDYL